MAPSKIFGTGRSTAARLIHDMLPTQFPRGHRHNTEAHHTHRPKHRDAASGTGGQPNRQRKKVLDGAWECSVS
jgi:hypothetical protein